MHGSTRAGLQDLCHTLNIARISDLNALAGSLYEQREMQWIEEKHRLDEEEEKLQLKQVLSRGAILGLLCFFSFVFLFLFVGLYLACLYGVWNSNQN